MAKNENLCIEMNLMRKQHILIIKYTNGGSSKWRERINLRIKISFFCSHIFLNGWICCMKNSHNLDDSENSGDFTRGKDREVYVHESVYWCAKKKNIFKGLFGWWFVHSFAFAACPILILLPRIRFTKQCENGREWEREDSVVMRCAGNNVYIRTFLFRSLWWARTQ